MFASFVTDGCTKPANAASLEEAIDLCETLVEVDLWCVAFCLVDQCTVYRSILPWKCMCAFEGGTGCYVVAGALVDLLLVQL